MSKTRFQWLDAVLAADLPDGAKVVAAYLFARADKDTLECHPRQDTIAADTGRTDRSVRRALDALAAAGFLEAQRKDCYAVNTYRLQRTIASGPEDSSVRSPEDSSVRSPEDSSVRSSKQAFEPAKEQRGVAVMKAAGVELGVFQLLDAQAAHLIGQVEAKGVHDAVGWLVRKFKDMSSRRVRVHGANHLVKMLIADINNITEAEAKDSQPARQVTDAQLMEEAERWM